MQQIDSLHFVAVSDTGTMILTPDGGLTWSRMALPTVCDLYCVHFSDTNNGIVVGDRPIPVVLTTSDGGRSWQNPKLEFNNTPAACRAVGPGAYRVLCGLNGPILRTDNNWKTIDSTTAIFDVDTEAAHGRQISISSMRWQDDKNYWVDGVYSTDNAHMQSIAFRSSNGGSSWLEVSLPNTGTGIRSTTSFGRDTVWASAPIPNNLLKSTDSGATWRLDTLMTKPAFSAAVANGLAQMPDGSLIGCFSTTDSYFGVHRIYRLKPATASVESYERIIYGTQVYPNPASISFNIHSNDPGHDVSVEDILGRAVLTGHIGADGHATFNVAALPRGVYQLRINHDGKLLPVGRVVLVGE